MLPHYRNRNYKISLDGEEKKPDAPRKAGKEQTSISARDRDVGNLSKVQASRPLKPPSPRRR